MQIHIDINSIQHFCLFYQVFAASSSNWLRHILFHVQTVSYQLNNLAYSIVPNLGVNYPNWVTSSFDLGNGLFFYKCFNRNIFYWAQIGKGKTGPTVAIINENRRIKIIDYSFHLFPFNWVCKYKTNKYFWEKYCCSRAIGDGVTTQRRGAILGKRSKKVGKHWLIQWLVVFQCFIYIQIRWQNFA